jgi:hypothetical protein
VSSPSDPVQPLSPAGSGQSSTQEIPVAQPTGATSTRQLPPHPDTAPPAPVDAPEPTGPVDFVPGLPGPTPSPGAAAAAAPPPPVPPRPVPEEPGPATAAGPIWPDTLDADEPERPSRVRRIGAPRNRTALIGLGLVVLSLVLLELGLTLAFGGKSYWDTVPLWSAFASVCGLLGLLAFAAFYPAGNHERSGPAWRVAAGGLVGLAVFWLLVVLPVVASDRGFVLTAALAALGGALWIGPRSRA